jgi:hypothetical protein
MTVSFPQPKSVIKMDVFGSQSIQKLPEKLDFSRVIPPEKRPIVGGSGGIRFPING